MLASLAPASLPAQAARSDSALSTAITGTRPQPTRGSARRMQVFSEAFTASAHGPYYVDLDSGITYRVFIDQTDTASTGLLITPRSVSMPPIRFSNSMVLGNNGIPFVAPATASYRVESYYGGREAIMVRIYREAADAYSTICVTNPTADGCRGASDVASRPGHGVSPAVLIMVGFLPLLLAGMMRNGKSF